MPFNNAPGFYNPKVTAIQGTHSTTFTPPDLNTALTIPEIFKLHAERSPNHAVFLYADNERQQHFIRYPEVYRAIRKAATSSTPSLKSLLDDSRAEGGDGDHPVVGILAHSGELFVCRSCQRISDSELHLRLNHELHLPGRLNVSRCDTLPHFNSQLAHSSRSSCTQDGSSLYVR